MLCDCLFWLSTIVQESQQSASRGRVLAFYRIALNCIQNIAMPLDFFGNLIFAIIARMFCGNELLFNIKSYSPLLISDLASLKQLTLKFQ